MTPSVGTASVDNADAPEVSAAADFMGHINMMKTDMPFCATYGPDPPLHRANTGVVAVQSSAARLPQFTPLRAAITDIEGADAASVRLEQLYSDGRWHAVALSLEFGSAVVMSSLVCSVGRSTNAFCFLGATSGIQPSK
jgi:hypothetical protein